jgi:phosphomevalonate kinase
VAVEPRELSPLLDEIAQLQGVAYCLCPGSGGYDAVFVLALGLGS